MGSNVVCFVFNLFYFCLFVFVCLCCFFLFDYLQGIRRLRLIAGYDVGSSRGVCLCFLIVCLFVCVCFSLFVFVALFGLITWRHMIETNCGIRRGQQRCLSFVYF